ncbi:uncharacterized protein METZ01_LOCUS234989, partial [marine metagenome]
MLKRILYLLIVSTMFRTLSGESSREKITFQSANPFGFNDVMSALDEQDDQEVFGYLTFPDNDKEGKLPLVIGVAGSLGWGEHHYEYLNMYRE